MKLKGNKKKKTSFFKLRYLFYILIIYVSFSFSYYFLTRCNNYMSNDNFIELLLNGDDISFLYKNKTNLIVNKTMKMLFNINLSNPSSILDGSLFNGNMEVSYNDSDYVDINYVSDYIEDPNSIVIDSPLVYLYNSHQLENYNSDYLEIYGIKPNVQMASYLLKEKLNNLGIKTIVEEANISNILKERGWAYYRSYDVTRELINDVRKRYPSIKYFIDIHRDSVSKEYTTINIDNKYYAKVLFILGMDYSTYDKNLILMNKINSKIDELYPGLSRGILKKSGKGVNGIYNQDIDSNVILIEVGSVFNGIEEVNNTCDVLSDILNNIIGDDLY